jgi:hypothetical protein
MSIIRTVMICVVVTGCVSVDCLEDCYITEQTKYQSRWEAVCDTQTFDRRCEGRAPIQPAW